MASNLRARGYVIVRQLLPPSKLKHLFSDAGAGVGEALAAVDLVRELRVPSLYSCSGRSGSSTTLTSAGRPAVTADYSKVESTSTSGGVGHWGRAKNRKLARSPTKRDPSRIMVDKSELGDISLHVNKGDGWDAQRYIAQPEQSLKPRGSNVKQQGRGISKVRT